MIWVFIIMFSYGLFEWAWVVQKRWMYLYKISHIKYHIYITIHIYIYIYKYQITILDIDVTVRSFCWSVFDHLQTPHWMKPPDLVDHQGTFVHFRAILDAAIVFAMLTLGFSKVSDEISESAMYDWYIHVYPMYDWYIFHLQLAIAGIFHMSTYGYPVRNWQKSIAPEAIVQLWKSSRNHMGRQ